jgi:Ca2+-binding EF-hand superfamily protein
MADYDDARKAAARKVVEADAAARSRAARDDAETKRAARRRDVERSAVLKLRNHVDARMTALRVARDERVAARAAAAATAAGDDATATTTTTTESTWVTTKRPVFVSFAAGEDASFHELRFVARFAARIETAGAGALFRIESGHPVPGVTREDKALLRAEAAKDAEAVVFVVTPASLRCERCELERDVVTTRREPVDLGGDGARVPCVALLDAEDVSSESAARPPSVDVPPRLLARDDPPAFRLSLPDRPADGVAPHADPAAAAARFVLRSLVDVGVLSPLDVDVDAIEDVADVVDETKIIAKTRFETKPATAAPLDDRRVKALLDAMGGSWKKRRPLEWSVEEVAAWVSSLGGDVGAASEKFRALGVDGRLLFALNDQTLRQTLGVTLAETRTRTLRSIADLATDRTRALNGDTRTVTFDGGDDDDDAAARLARMNDDELDAFVADLFVAADADRSGALDRREFKTLLKNANLGFSAKERQTVMEECDDDGDGLVSFAEFSRATRGVIRTAAARRRAAIKSRRGGGGRHFGSTFKVTRNTNRRAEASSALLRGVDRATVEGCLRRVFDAADVDGNGWLDRREFARCLRSHDLGFTRKEVNSLLTSVDGDFDGRVQIDEFIPVAFTLLVERLADDAARVEASSNPTALARVLYAKLKSAAKGKDAVPTVVARDALLSLRDDGIGITRTHAALVLAEARVNSGNKTLPWRPFVETAVTSLWSLLDDDLAATRRKVVAAVADGSGVTTLASLDRAALHGALSAAFAAADVDGSGALDVDEAKAALASIGATIKARPPPTYLLALVPIRSHPRGERRSLRTFSPGASLRARHGFINPDAARRLSTPTI